MIHACGKVPFFNVLQGLSAGELEQEIGRQLPRHDLTPQESCIHKENPDTKQAIGDFLKLQQLAVNQAECQSTANFFAGKDAGEDIVQINSRLPGTITRACHRSAKRSRRKPSRDQE